MLSGSTFLRVGLLLIAAAVVAGLVQHYWVHDGGLPETPVVAAPPKSGPSAAVSAARTPPPSPPAAQPDPPRAETPPPPSPPPEREATLVPRPAPEPPPVREAPAAIPAAPEPPQPEGEQAVAAADANADPRAVDQVNLNTGSLAQLNGLKGGGSIGRSIIQHRPYESIDQLLTKRVLNRATYQRIKDQVTVR